MVETIGYVLNFECRILFLIEFTQSLSFRRKEKSPQVAPQRESKLCKVSGRDFSFVEMIDMEKFIN